MKICCPKCHEPLYKEGNSAYCRNGHCYNYAKSGYLNLSFAKAKGGDNKLMTNARTAFLNKGYYSFLRDKMVETYKQTHASFMVDLACGEGYYTQAFPDERLGIDLSISALKEASKKDKDGLYVLSSIFSVPLENESTSFVLTCFAPTAQKEIVRILSKDGYFLKISPAKDHLFGIKEKLYEHPYLNEEKIEDIPSMTLLKREIIRQEVSINNPDDLQNLLKMTPYYYHSKKVDMERFQNESSLSTPLSFVLDLYQKN